MSNGRHSPKPGITLAILLWIVLSANGIAAEGPGATTSAPFMRIFQLQDYNTRIVILGTMLLGMACGLVGSFTLLRRRALIGDALSHATLPGIGLAFLIAPSLGLDGKSLPVLLPGAAISGGLGVLAILAIQSLPKLKEDAALGIVLSVFFGAGVSVLTVAQQLESGHMAGLESFIYGSTASMTASDATLIAWAGLISTITLLLFFRQLKLLCFDEAFTASRGYSVAFLDLLLMAVVMLVTIAGLQAVGLVLMIALLVIPAAAARFWTHQLHHMVMISAGIGSVSGLLGAAISGVFSNLPSGAVIVLVCSALFFLSLLFGRARGVFIRIHRRRELQRAIDREHLLRGIYELREDQLRKKTSSSPPVAARLSELTELRSWSLRQLRRQIRRSAAEGLLWQRADGELELTERGIIEAERLVHNHRLWELYLMTHAEVAASRVDRLADAVEHVLEPELVARLEALLEKTHGRRVIPAS
ncbi:MAG: Manganese transport system rane protein MntB, partial [Planctomycetota bacterium]